MHARHVTDCWMEGTYVCSTACSAGWPFPHETCQGTSAKVWPQALAILSASSPTTFCVTFGERISDIDAKVERLNERPLQLGTPSCKYGSRVSRV